MSFFTPAQGFHAPGEGLGGHDSLSDDGSGDVILAAGKRLILPTSSSPQIITKEGGADTGMRITDAFLYLYNGGAPAFTLGGALAMFPTNGFLLEVGDLTIEDSIVLESSATQNITGVGSIISVNAPTLKISSDGVYTLTTSLAAGADGQEIVIENVSATNTVTLQEGAAVAQGLPVVMKYSTDQAAWEQI